MIGVRVNMKKYLWTVLFFVTTSCFAQPNAEINQASTDNNLVIQLVDSKLVNLDNKIAAVAQSNQDGIADFKARTDEKLADKFKQLDDRGFYVSLWMWFLAFWLTFFGLLTPIGAWWINKKTDKNIKDSQELLDKEIKNAEYQIKSKLQEADRLINQIRDNHKKSQELTEQQEEMRKTPPKEVTEQNQSDIEKISEVLAEKSENQLTAKDWFIKGLNAQNNEEYYEAISYYNHAIKLNPNFVESYNNRGNAKCELKQHEEAVKDYDKAMELRPNYAICYNNRGIPKAKLKQYDEALKDYDTAIKLAPKNVKAYFNKACVYVLMKNKPEALNWLERALQLDYSVEKVLKDEDWKDYLDDADFKILLAKYNK